MKNNRVLALLVVAVLLASFFTYVFAQSASNSFTLSPGIYPGAPTYTIYTDGTNYYAKNAYGQISFTSTNCSYVANSAINDLTTGKILFAEGQFNVSAPIVLKEGIIVEGMGMYSTIIYLEDGSNCDVFQWTPVGIELMAGVRNLMINGNKAGNTDGNGIYLAGSTWDFEVYRVWIYQPIKAGVRVVNSLWGHKYYSLIVEEAGTYGFWASGSSAEFVSCRFSDITLEGVVGAIVDSVFSGCEFQNCISNGLDLGGAVVYGNGTDPTTVGHSGTKVIGCYFISNGLGGAANADNNLMLADNCVGCIITGNTFTGYYQTTHTITTNHHISFYAATAYDNIITGNYFIDNASTCIGGSIPSGNIIENNFGYP